MRAIEGSSWGLVTIDPALLESLKPRSRSILERLTQPQLIVLEKIAAGYSDVAICEQMGIDAASLARLASLVYEDLGIPADGPTNPRVKAALVYLNETTTSGNSVS